MTYADFKYYTAEFKGSAIPETAFDKFALDASDYIDSVTFDRLHQGTPITEAVKKACCACAEVFQGIQKTQQRVTDGKGDITSEKVGDYSVNYGNQGVLRALAGMDKTAEQQLYTTARRYLGHTGLMYRGVMY